MPKSLRKVSSCPALSADQKLPRLQPGNFIKLRLYLSPTHFPEELCKSSIVVTAEIVKRFFPFTLSQVMLVRLITPVSHALSDLERDFILKLYDRRLMQDLREEWKMPPWSHAAELDYRKFAFRDVYLAQYASFRDLDDSDSEDEDDTVLYDTFPDGTKKADGFSDEADDGGTTSATDFDISKAVPAETEVHEYTNRMYDAEQECYRRLHTLQGNDVPCCYGRVELLDTPITKSDQGPASLLQESSCPQFALAPGLLLQHIPKAYSLYSLYNSEGGPYPPVPKLAFQHIGEEAARIIQLIMSYEILNKDDGGFTRNTLVHWDPFSLKWKVFMIDFGQCVFRKEGESERDWRCRQAWEDEEGRSTTHLAGMLERYRGGGYVSKKSQYREQLDWDFMMEDGPRI